MLSVLLSGRVWSCLVAVRGRETIGGPLSLIRQSVYATSSDSGVASAVPPPPACVDAKWQRQRRAVGRLGRLGLSLCDAARRRGGVGFACRGLRDRETGKGPGGDWDWALDAGRRPVVVVRVLARPAGARRFPTWDEGRAHRAARACCSRRPRRIWCGAGAEVRERRCRCRETGPALSSGRARLEALVRRCEAARSMFSLSGHGAALPGLPRARTQARLTCGRSLCCPRSQVCAIRSVAGASWSTGYVPGQRSELGDLLSISPSSLGARCRVFVSPLGCWVKVEVEVEGLRRRWLRLHLRSCCCAC